MTEDEALLLLRQHATPTKRALAASLQVTPQYLGDVFAGRRNPARLLERFGLRRVEQWIDMRSAGVV